MSIYLPLLISAVLIIAIILWWLTARGGTKQVDGTPKDIAAPPAAVPASPIAPAAKAAVPPKSMGDPAPVKKAAKAKAKAPAKAAVTKKAPAAKVAAPKAAAAKAAAPKVAPKAKAAKPPVKPSIPDNLELIKGLGPKVNSMLKALGVNSFAQVANWTAADVAEMDGKLGAFAGRITRDNWVDQAQLLAAGDVAGFEQKYGALGAGVKA